MKEKYKFLENGTDFPFYNDKPKLSTFDWMIITCVVFSLAHINTYGGQKN